MSQTGGFRRTPTAILTIMEDQVICFVQDFRLQNAPSAVRERAKDCLMDLCGIGLGGARTKLSQIICDHAVQEFRGDMPLMFVPGTASPLGVALAGGMTIDALDGHDGFNPAKGHVGCALLPGLLALAPEGCDGTSFLEAVILGYELGSRLGPQLHHDVPDYHTSGAWMAIAVALAGGRLVGLTAEALRHAAGIAEFHGPRSQMMRVIDTPSMLKDGSGWGAMAGVSAAKLAARGFSGAPALTLSGSWWKDIGSRWLILEQYFKPYPTCRWSHPPVEAALGLRKTHEIDPQNIVRIEIETFHESVRLAMRSPTTTEEAQYSTSFPLAIALARGGIGPFDLDDDVLDDPLVRRLSLATVIREDETANAVFPGRRKARVTLTMTGGESYRSDWVEPIWEGSAPPSHDDLRAKYEALARPVAGDARANAILSAIEGLEEGGLAPLRAALKG